MPTLAPASYAQMVKSAIDQVDRHALGKHFSLLDPHTDYLWMSLGAVDQNPLTPESSLTFKRVYASRLSNKTPWAELLTLHTQALTHMNCIWGADYLQAYSKQHELVNTLLRWLLSGSVNNAWCLQVLYAVCTDLKRLAELADAQLAASAVEEDRKKGVKHLKLEEASRLLQKCFSACLNDRHADAGISRKMGVYFMSCLLFKTYFRLSSTSLCTNIIRGIKAAALSPFEDYPASHRVTYSYYMGVFSFLREQYDEAEKHFSYALEWSYRVHQKNLKLILDYLIPLQLLRGVLPSKSTFKLFSQLRSVYQPFAKAIRNGDVRKYDQHLIDQEKTLMEKGTYLIVEKAREGAVRALLKKAWILGGKPPKMPIMQFLNVYKAATTRLNSSQPVKEWETSVDEDEMECILANMIFKGLIKGYISHQHSTVVLSKDKPFPWYGPHNKSMSVADKEARSQKETAERQRVPVDPNAMQVS